MKLLYVYICTYFYTRNKSFIFTVTITYVRIFSDSVRNISSIFKQKYVLQLYSSFNRLCGVSVLPSSVNREKPK